MSSSNRLLLSIGLISCVGVERAEIARKEPAQNLLEPTSAELSEMAEEIEHREAYLESRRDAAQAIATAVLHDSRGRQTPALGTAALEVNAGGLGLRIAANLDQGTHHVYLLDEATDCSKIDLAKRKLIGSPDPARSDYVGALVNVRNGAATFEKYLPEGVPVARRIFGRPLVVVHAKGGSAVCGVFQEYETHEEAVASQ